MEYITRHIVKSLERFASSFPVVLVTGPRQVGKTTLLKHWNPDLAYITFDDPMELLSAKNDARTFMMMHVPPVIFDEIQYASELFSYIKIQVDDRNETGMYYLAGSQQFNMMQHVSESLAGRIGILHMLGLSIRERNADVFDEPFLPSLEYLQKRNPAKQTSIQDLWQMIYDGGFPSVVTGRTLAEDYYRSYVKTYIERDVRALTQIGDELQFLQFISVIASRTGQQLNYRDIARDTGISEPTVKKWLSVLVATGLVYLLRPYSTNVEKRVVKTPKVYFLDTGLAIWLTKWPTPETVAQGAMAGAFFETFVISEIYKSWINAGKEPPIYYYRDKDQKEIDLLLEVGGTLYPIEIKKTATPKKSDISAFSMLKRTHGRDIGSGAVVCPCDKLGILDTNVFTVPVFYI